MIELLLEIWFLASVPLALLAAYAMRKGREGDSLGARLHHAAAEGGRPPGAPGRPSGRSRQGEQPEGGGQG